MQTTRIAAHRAPLVHDALSLIEFPHYAGAGTIGRFAPPVKTLYSRIVRVRIRKKAPEEFFLGRL